MSDEDDPSISPNSNGITIVQNDHTELRFMHYETPDASIQIVDNNTECPEHGTQPKFQISSYLADPWSINVGCAKCMALELKRLVESRPMRHLIR